MIFKEWGVGCNIKLTLIGKFFSDFDIFYPEIIFFLQFLMLRANNPVIYEEGEGVLFFKKIFTPY